MVFALLLLLSGKAWSACNSSDDPCTEWQTVERGRVLTYLTHPLDVPNRQITQAVIVIHGGGRNADRSLETIKMAATSAGILQNTLIVAPRFSANNGACEDKLARKEVNWPCGSWQAGAIAVNQKRATAFDVVDDLLRQLARKDRFPNLKAITIAGHSAGGQFVTRYAVANQIHETLGELEIRYVVANPSTSMYLDGMRPTSIELPAVTSSEMVAQASVTLGAFQNANRCAVYNLWPYGPEKRAGYSVRVTDEALRRQLATRPATYLLGELDVSSAPGLDATCAGMSQGPHRLARGIAYVRYVNERWGAKYSIVVVPACGHNERCMFESAEARSLLFRE